MQYFHRSRRLELEKQMDRIRIVPNGAANGKD